MQRRGVGGRRDKHEPADAVGVMDREPGRDAGTKTVAYDRRASDPPSVEYRQRRPAVGLNAGGGTVLAPPWAVGCECRRIGIK